MASAAASSLHAGAENRQTKFMRRATLRKSGTGGSARLARSASAVRIANCVDRGTSALNNLEFHQKGNLPAQRQWRRG
eukprot:11180381-Lingulodinium_polyedra.AAC.1